ncbi:MAG: hypothetical protein HQK86_00795 [Nitrospinae bacterium]|nr:hypothetical protein [Nitrospinota bacterium]MBF0635022.1 hypothetical protein [Nitrospinota bacterium]
MQMPNYQAAIIRENKITDYLLSLTHPVGRFKARFWMKFGFTSSRHEALIDALRKHAYNDYVKSENTGFGVRYLIEAPLNAPDGRSPVVRSVWFVEQNGTIPVLITAYPA